MDQITAAGSVWRRAVPILAAAWLAVLLCAVGAPAQQGPAELPIPGLPGLGGSGEPPADSVEPEPGPPDGAGPAEEAGPEDRPPEIGERLIGALVGLVEGAATEIVDDVRALGATMAGLNELRHMHGARLAEILRGLSPGLAAAALAWLTGRWITGWLFRRIGAGADRDRPVRVALRALLCLGIDLVWVGLVSIAATAALARTGGQPVVTEQIRTGLLAAIVVAGAVMAILRAVLNPASAALRPFPVSDATARSVEAWLSSLVVMIAFAELLLRPILGQVATVVATRATMVVIYLLALAVLFHLVLRYRDAPAHFFEQKAAEFDGDLTYSMLAWVSGYWHWIVLPYLVVLLHHAVTPGQTALPLLVTLAELAATSAAGAFLVTVIARFGERGLRMPASVNRVLPTIEPRVNAFVPVFLRLVRFLVLLLWIGYAVGAVGLVDLWDLVEARIGVDALAASTSVLVIVLLAFLAWLLVSSWIDFRMTPRLGHYPTARERTLLSLLKNAATVAILLIGLTYLLSELGISVAPLLASAGVLGLAIGFGAQRMVEDIIGGIFIQLENAVNVGDVVDAGGHTGVVEKLTIRSLSLRDVNGVFHLIPFSSVGVISNYMKGFGYHVADIGVAYSADLDRARAEMGAAFDDIRADPDLGGKLFDELEWFGVNALADSAVVLRARLKTIPGEQWAIGRAYTERVKRRFDAAGIEIPFPQRRLWIGDAVSGLPPPLRPAGGSQSVRGRPTDADDSDGGEAGDR